MVKAELSASTNSNRTIVEDICLTCGLCCNGVIFADVRLQPDENAERLRSLGLPISGPRNGRPANGQASLRPPKFPQPCAAYDGCRCRIYGERPKYCREFECVLLKSVQAGHTQIPAALRVIRTARQRAEKVRRLLRALGDTNEQLSLGARFRRTAKRLEEVGLDEQTADTYGKLTLAVQDLNLLLSEAFYPGDGG